MFLNACILHRKAGKNVKLAYLCLVEIAFQLQSSGGWCSFWNVIGMVTFSGGQKHTPIVITSTDVCNRRPGSGPARRWACTALSLQLPPSAPRTHTGAECPRDQMFCSEAYQGELTLPTVIVSVDFIPRLETSLCSEHEQCRPSVDKMIPQLVGI